jgi:hypothetical protein
LEGIWDGFFRQRYLGSSNMVKQSERIWGGGPLPFELVDWTELPFKVDWPPLDLEKAIAIYDPANEGQTWLVKPEVAKQAVERLFRLTMAWHLMIQPGSLLGMSSGPILGAWRNFGGMGWCAYLDPLGYRPRLEAFSGIHGDINLGKRELKIFKRWSTKNEGSQGLYSH